MKSLEWNPAFGPVAMALIILGTALFFYLLVPKLRLRHGRLNSWILLSPKILIAGLLVLALLDPDLKFSGSNSNPARVVILQDISSSMDLRDDGNSARKDRAAKLIQQIESEAPSSVHFDVLPFDTELHDAKYVPKDPAADRGTDLASMLASLGSQEKIADADGVILLTDGGDETIEPAAMPTTPLAIIGVGSAPDNWNDIGIGSVTVPASVEEKSQFDFEADLYARGGTHANLSAIKVALEEGHDKTWTEAQSQTVDLSSLHAAVLFHVHVNTPGTERYRLRLQQLPGEVTYANNDRIVNVQVQQRALHVLYFTQELGVDYKYLRTELGADPGVAFTAMYRVLQDQFTVQGDRTGFEDLAKGFPTSDDVLKRYDCVILGSFAASQLTDAQQQTISRFVENGGALILLGGESSFGLGGYADSKLAPLMPWMIRADEPALSTGTFPVAMSPSAAAVDFTAGLREDLSAAGGASLISVNEPGGLRPGAVALLDATVTGGTEPVVAWQRFGKGQVLGVATNTMWKWAAAGSGTREVFGRFWRQSVRGLTKKLEGGTLLGVRWDHDLYRPGEEAVVEVRQRTASSAGAFRLVGTINGPDGLHDVSLAPISGQADLFTAKIPFLKRGDYTFHLSAYTGSNLAESYERILPVQPSVEEGGMPELKDEYLRSLATRVNGVYTSEKDIEPVLAFLRGKVVTHQLVVTVPLVDFWNILPVLILAILVGEWTLRRRFNLV